MVKTRSSLHVFFGQDGRWLFQILPDHLCVWHVGDRKCIYEVPGAFLGISCDGTIMLTTGENGQLFVMSLVTGEALNIEHVNHALFSRHQRVLLHAGITSITITDVLGVRRRKKFRLSIRWKNMRVLSGRRTRLLPQL